MILDPKIVAEVAERWRGYGGHRMPPRDLGPSSDAARKPGAEANKGFWAKRGLEPTPDGKQFRAIAPGRPSAIDGVSLSPDRRAERILGSSDLMEVVFLEVALAVSRTVARVRVNGPAGILVGYGTGFLVSPRLLLTNWHVLKTDAIAKVSTAEFGYETRLGEGAARAGHIFRLEPEKFFLSHSELDFALVAVAPVAPDGTLLADFRFNRLIDDDETLIAEGQYSNIIQHPSGQPKQLAFRQNEVIKKPGDFLHYRTDTAPGSSGAPVFNDQWQVVALHRAGVWATNDAGQVLAVDGTVWREEMGEDRIRWLANEGVRIPRLLKRCADLGPRGAAGEYLEELVSPQGPSALEGLVAGASVPAAEARPVQQAGNGSPTVEVAPDGTATWTIPLRVSVGLGVLGAPGAGGAALPPPEVPAKPVTIVETPPADLNTIIQKATETFTKGRTDVLRVRAGWKFDDAGITDERAIVVTVAAKRTPAELAAASVTELPRSFMGYPVEIMGPSVADFLRSKVGPQRVETLLATSVSPEEITYEPPAGLSLDPVTDEMRVIAHVSPDAGWPTLRPFIDAARKKLVGAMYEFTAEHVRDALTATADRPAFEQLILTLDSTRGSARNDPNKPDSEAMVRAMREVLGDKLAVSWVKLGSVNGWVNHDYHIKVLVRDRKALWLSSGNWKESGQPDVDPAGDDRALRRALQAYNREWHAIIEHAGLAKTYETAILGDFEANRNTRPEELALPELEFIGAAQPMAEEAMGAVEYFAPFDQRRQFTVQPILTPDNYLDVVLPAVKRARRSLLLQNQSLATPPQNPDPRYVEFWETVLQKQKRGLDVRLIFRLQDRDPSGGREMYEKLKDFGFDGRRIKIQKGCHTKGILIDGKRVLLGSHNLTNMGATTNRDASLLFDDEDLTQYFMRLFEHDWLHVAEPLTRRHWRNSELREAGAGGAEEGFQPFDWKAWLEGA